jgi:hypothetical protein
MEGAVILGLCLDCQGPVGFAVGFAQVVSNQETRVPLGECRCRTKYWSHQEEKLARLADLTAADSHLGDCTALDSVVLERSWDWFLEIGQGFLLPSRFAHLCFVHRLA